MHQFINNGLMAIFFLLVGLEIKRELLAGELVSLRQAALPIARCNRGHRGAPGRVLAVQLATAQKRLAGESQWQPTSRLRSGCCRSSDRVQPTGAKVFLVALAIVDDMGAVLVIALSYTSSVVWELCVRPYSFWLR